MVIKILQSTANIEAVNYSEEKIEKNEAKLIKAENFPFQDMTATQHRKYLEAVGKLNPRVKKKQFHAAISTKGRAHTFEQLTAVGEHYLKHMGYQDNPYIIYAHHDSAHNHIHIVSSRIGLDGKKISDSLEKKRSQDFIRYELKIDFSATVEKTTADVLGYSISTPTQFEHLMSLQGYQTKLKGDNYHIYKSAITQHTIPLAKVQDAIRTKGVIPKNKKQLQAFLHKYALASSYKELKNDLHQKFGMEVIWHYPKQIDPKWENQKKVPFGYTIIDHKNKAGYKGSELLPLKTIEKLFQKDTLKDRTAALGDLLSNTPNMSIKAYKAALDKKGFVLQEHTVVDAKSQTPVFEISKDQKQQLTYHGRIEHCNALHTSNHISNLELAQLFDIKAQNILPKQSKLTPEVLNQYRSLVLHHQQSHSTGALKQNNMHLFTHNNQQLLFDSKAKILLNVEKDLGILKTIQRSHNVQNSPNNAVSKNGGLAIFFDTHAAQDGTSKRRKRTTDFDNEVTL